jgi:hypothetical protein
MSAIDDLISPFIASVASGEIEIYNEFSLQHELGIFLRSRLPTYKTQFERNVRFFVHGNSVFTKREIDIVVFSLDRREWFWAIELKYPRNGQHPEQMFSFCKDVAFVEELRRAGFANAAFVAFADDPLFYRGPTEGIYGFFRGGRPLHGSIKKPTGLKDMEVTVSGTYSVMWQPVRESLKYCVIEATPTA